MEVVKVYLSGGMSELSLEEQTKWRNKVQNAIKYGDFDLNKNVVFFDPTQYFSIFTSEHKSEREAMNFDLYNLRKSDLVIVNFNAPKSIGTAMELMLAKELNIPIVGLNKDGVELHPWLIECTDRMCTDMKELVNYIVDFYLK